MDVQLYLNRQTFTRSHVKQVPLILVLNNPLVIFFLKERLVIAQSFDLINFYRYYPIF
jgi:hypothetical protein